MWQMKKRLKTRVFATLLSLILHLVVIVALSVPHVRPGQVVSNPGQILEVRLGAIKHQSEVPLQQSVPEPPGLLAKTNEAITASNPFNVQQDIDPDLQWAEGFPQLSNTPLPLFQPISPVEEKIYFPASDLEIRPAPNNPLIIPFPDAILKKQKVSAILILFISAEGRVEKIEVDESDLPEEFEKVAIDTFMQAQMRPGIKNGKPVPALMKIAVDFEAK